VFAAPPNEWIEGRRYLGLDVLNRARATTINPTEEQPPSTPALTA
jgi:putative transposase